MTEGNSARADRPKEWDASAYHTLSEPQFGWGLRVLERVSLGGTERVLDAGCGSGRVTAVLASRLAGGRVVGCDLSENMTRAAAKSLGSAAAAAVVCADLSMLPFRGVFDLVFSTATFHWIRDHDRLFAELRAALRPGGRLEAQCGGGPNLHTIHARADALALTAPFRPHFAGWEEPWLFASPEETAARLARAEFTAIDCWLEHAPTSFPDRERFGAFIESVVMRPYLARLPDPDLRRRFLEAILALAEDDDPPLTLDYWRLNISAATM
jgi:trans-aconitate 2-methyltransferase